MHIVAQAHQRRGKLNSDQLHFLVDRTNTGLWVHTMDIQSMTNLDKQPVSAAASPPLDDPAWLDQGWLADEQNLVESLLRRLTMDRTARGQVRQRAIDLVEAVRRQPRAKGMMEAFMREYDLSSEEGVVLMCLAEALLRVPDAETAERLIADKLSEANWEEHLGRSESIFVNASTWGLMLTGRLVRVSQSKRRDLSSLMARLVNRSGEPAIRMAIGQAMKIMGHQYVMGRTIKEALKRAHSKSSRHYRYSFDMLGEAALTAEDAARYAKAYHDAIGAITPASTDQSVFEVPSISVKLSALHPRYERAQSERVLQEMVPVLRALAEQARAQGIALTVDAEEADRLSLSLQVFAAVRSDPSLASWDGLGLAVQAYHKRSLPVIAWLAELARENQCRVPVRLVKGAYWDSEIKLAQANGLDGYPVFTRKASTDLSYLVCAQQLLAEGEAFYPQFATHNAHTIAAIAHMAKSLGVEAGQFEYQRLHGMGEPLYETVRNMEDLQAPCRVYAPVGAHEDLLPYLVRRLLENGANTSFVNRIVDTTLSAEQVVSDPVTELAGHTDYRHPRIPLPTDLYGPARRNAQGMNLNSLETLATLDHELTALDGHRWGHADADAPAQQISRSPLNTDDVVGHWVEANDQRIDQAVTAALAAQPEWDAQGFAARAELLLAFADQLEAQRSRLMSLVVREAGKSLPDALAEVREAVDFCRYYAAQARDALQAPQVLPGPTGESNTLIHHGRGVFVCISPWNFPLAIFVGQVAAALVTGNTVIAKPAEQTPLVALEAVRLLHQTGVPSNVVQCLCGGGAVGARLCADARIAGVAFTGSTVTARTIQHTLAQRTGPLATLIAETGGQNAMIVDSSALPEQVVRDVITSGFLSAGQRCSALRVLCLQEDIADRVLTMLAGAMQALVVGVPHQISTDVGPVIDAKQLAMLQAHDAHLSKTASLIARAPLPTDLPPGHWFAPVAYEINAINELGDEVFGPIVHVVRYKARTLDALVDQINALGYGLTLGIHSRIESVQQRIAARARVGNIYINRNMTGAVVGVQPFGGQGLSGTGPKAGGPQTLHRYLTEKTITINTAAVGGNASLLALSD